MGCIDQRVGEREFACGRRPAMGSPAVAGFPRVALAGDAVLVGIGADDTAVAGQGAQARAADGARVEDQSIVGRDVEPLDVAADGAGEVGLEDGGEGFVVGHGVFPSTMAISSAVNPYSS